MAPSNPSRCHLILPGNLCANLALIRVERNASRPSADYYRKQAQLCAQLALISSDPGVVARYNAMALEHLAKAVELDGGREGMQPAVRLPGADGSDMDRD